MAALHDLDAPVRGEFRIRGHVQGVCFRMCACDEARRLGLTGWVRNAMDGSVEATVEGPTSQVAEFLVWCRRGPSRARVEDVKAVYSPPRGEFTDFRIRH